MLEYLFATKKEKIFLSLLLTDGGHGDQGPPQTERDGLEVIIWIGSNSFCIVDQTGENDNAKN